MKGIARQFVHWRMESDLAFLHTYRQENVQPNQDPERWVEKRNLMLAAAGAFAEEAIQRCRNLKDMNPCQKVRSSWITDFRKDLRYP